MRRRVRLTESDLHRIIKESVSKVLNELDWKTLANAEKKASERGNSSYWRDKGEDNPIGKAVDARERAKRFGDAAKDAFNRDYGYKRGRRYDDGYAEVSLGGDFDATEEFSPHVIGYRDKGYGNPTKYEYGRDRDTYKEMSPEEFFQGNEDAAESFKNADAEFKSFKRGKYGYKKGKGWEKKD